MSDETDLHENALSYVKRELAVFPLLERDKLPATPNGFLNATKTVSEIDAWWNANPDSNVGLACGLRSMIVVLDIDAKHGGLASLEELERTYGKLPATWSCCTGGGGYHYYFLHPGDLARIPNSAGKIAPGIDIRGDGGYVVAPPSIHPNGKRYEWEIGCGPGEVELAPLPQWLRAKIIESPAERMQAKELPIIVSEGGRADAVTSFCGTLRRRGMPASEIAAHAKVWNETHCVPPLRDDQVDAIARSAARYAPGDPIAASGPVADSPAPAAEEKPARKGRGGSAKLEGPALHATLEEDLPRWLAHNGISINAIGEVINARDGSIASLRYDEIVLTYANHFRRCRQFVTKQYVEEVMGEMVRERSKARRDEVSQRVLTYRCPTDDALRLWLKAVTGEVRDLELAVMKHWLWQVKRSLSSLPIDHQLMPILLGQQGSGKSTAARLLCGVLEELACVPASGEMITDPRSIPSLSKYCAGVWDEMEGADRGSIEAIKRAITSAKMTYKPLYTNGTATVRITMQWFGTSNKSVASMVKDATGNRRFIEITSMPKCDWDALGAIDYRDVWGCVHHEDPPPIAAIMAQLVEAQRSQVYRDTVTAWMAEEEWREYTDIDGVQRPGRNTFANGVPSREVQSRYTRWCEYTRERTPLSGNALGMRLKEEGWLRKRVTFDDNGYRGWSYFPSVAYLADRTTAPAPPFGDTP